jgi:hypothetical protein
MASDAATLRIPLKKMVPWGTSGSKAEPINTMPSTKSPNAMTKAVPPDYGSVVPMYPSSLWLRPGNHAKNYGADDLPEEVDRA